MKISKLFTAKNPVVSFEIFPPKPESPFEPILHTVQQLKSLQPDFISVTYGAAGSNRGHTLELAEHIKNDGCIASLAHLTSIVNTPEEIADILAEMKERGIQNILALRGDPPQDSSLPVRQTHAKELVLQIKAAGDFCVGGAAYPEGHPECPDRRQELIYLKEKITAGTDFLITQIFFDNDFFYYFLERLAGAGLEIPVCAGIMPVFSGSQVRHICRLCGASLPPKLLRLIDKYYHQPAAMQEAGLEYACRQIDDLAANGVRGIHLYTMNKPHLATFMVKNTGLR